MKKWIPAGVGVCCFILILLMLTEHSSPHPFKANVRVTIPKAKGTSISYSIHGNRIYANNGSVYIPYGLYAIDLSMQDWQKNSGYMHADTAVFKEIQTTWHCNIIGIEVSYHNLYTKGRINITYMQVIDKLVANANNNKLNVLLTLRQNTVLPTSDTTEFWTYMGYHYQLNQSIFFDIFDGTPSPDASLPTWGIWQNGGLIGNTKYFGMQNIVTDIRSTGATNLIFIEGRNDGKDISKINSIPVSGGNIVFNLHIDNSNMQYGENEWLASIKNASSPIIIGKFSPDESCTGSHSGLSNFLAAVAGQHIGMIVWMLDPGSFIDATNINNSPPLSHTAGCSIDANDGPAKEIMNFLIQTEN